MDQTSDSKESSDVDWESDDELSAIDSVLTSVPGPSQSVPAQEEVCGVGTSRPKLVSHFVLMGFSEDKVIKAIEEIGLEERCTEENILETMLSHSAIENSSPLRKHSPMGSSSPSSETENILDDFSDTDAFGDEKCSEDLSEYEKKLRDLMAMGYNKDEASSAIGRFPEASVFELTDSIIAARTAEESDGFVGESPPSSWDEDELVPSSLNYSSRGKKRKSVVDTKKWKKRVRLPGSRKEYTRKFVARNEPSSMACVPNPMIGFGLPGGSESLMHRKLPESAMGPPYFYYENVALTPKGVWQTISRFLHEIEPEFVDSKYFCAAARKRGYVHNLPIHNRFQLRPLPPRTIHEALPSTKKWWPSWDPRTHLNCLQTCIASSRLTERIRCAVSSEDDPPPDHVQKYVLHECRKWNLVWVGLHKVAPLEPDEIEMLLGFPRDHTRGGGISRTERYRSLGNSFQVDTVAYHLSVLKDIFPNGMTVLSLFSGIGGAELALHRLGISLKAVVSVEISEVNRNILRSWWEQTEQSGTLIHISDVQQLNGDVIENYIHRFGGFDLVIGGSPCNNLAGSNRVSRDGLEGKESSLFYEYFRILDVVNMMMRKPS